MRDPDMISRARRAAATLERAWERWRIMHGMSQQPSPPVSSYVGYSIEEPWGRPRVVFGVDAAEAEMLAVLLDRHECVGPYYKPAPGPADRSRALWDRPQAAGKRGPADSPVPAGGPVPAQARERARIAREHGQPGEEERQLGGQERQIPGQKRRSAGLPHPAAGDRRQVPGDRRQARGDRGQSVEDRRHAVAGPAEPPVSRPAPETTGDDGVAAGTPETGHSGAAPEPPGVPDSQAAAWDTGTIQTAAGHGGTGQPGPAAQPSVAAGLAGWGNEPATGSGFGAAGGMGGDRRAAASRCGPAHSRLTSGAPRATLGR